MTPNDCFETNDLIEKIKENGLRGDHITEYRMFNIDTRQFFIIPITHYSET